MRLDNKKCTFSIFNIRLVGFSSNIISLKGTLELVWVFNVCVFILKINFIKILMVWNKFLDKKFRILLWQNFIENKTLCNRIKFTNLIAKAQRKIKLVKSIEIIANILDVNCNVWLCFPAEMHNYLNLLIFVQSIPDSRYQWKKII